MEESELVRPRRRIFNEARTMAMYLAQRLRKDRFMDIGSEFGLGGTSSVSSVLQGIGKQLMKDQRLQERYEVLRKALIGQS